MMDELSHLRCFIFLLFQKISFSKCLYPFKRLGFLFCWIVFQDIIHPMLWSWLLYLFLTFKILWSLSAWYICSFRSTKIEINIDKEWRIWIFYLQPTYHFICWCCRLKLRRIYMSGRLHLRMLWHKHRVLPMWWSKMVPSGTIRLIQLIFLWTSACSCYSFALHMSFDHTITKPWSMTCIQCFKKPFNCHCVNICSNSLLGHH